ncbi:NACHT domain protein [Aspergillus clavatus NRRL 1]|uniref:NACHT domain protein n=1 Tax=Aspergillus clavatus (strain ATCC 1007 / CBS 513.65 / DSM 816 / NCTC 3887 / NRRL 1 / QM 1276 / 107) TaxID=344612 RepID=A1CFG0_ASPCL|nr:NACHT domain protein [Aspergillus clavatus NRRL 1]EAW11609.1 NACHT domain protein [Aspergillus clavatus NRRL 1]
MAASVTSPLPSGLLAYRRRTSGLLESDSVSNNGIARSVTSRRVSSKRFKTVETSEVSNLVYSLKRRSGNELGSNASSKLLNHTHDSVLDWIRIQRMSLLPPEGSSYDKVLSWAQLSVERLHSFNLAIEEFAGDSYLAAQLAYGYCALLLELGQENASALMISFGFFYSTSMKLGNLLERTELFGISQEIREQLVLALADLVTLVASVSMHFHKAIRKLTTASISIDLYKTFPGQIQTFRDRCERITESMWRYQLLKENLDADKVSDSKTIKLWLAPEDHVLASVAEQNSHLAHDRDELTCLWMAPYLARFLKSPLKSLAIAGKPGSGRTVLASVIVDQLQHPIGGVAYSTLFVPINAKVPAETTPRAVAKSILHQLFDRRIGNVQMLQILSVAYERSRKALNEQDYDQILWNALEAALCVALTGAKELVIVVDGVDEASCSEATLLQLLATATAKAPNAKVITLGAQKPPTAADRTFVQITDELIFDDIATVVRNQLQQNRAFAAMPDLDQETIVEQITEASQGSFLWGRLAAQRVCHEHTEDGLLKEVDALVESNLSLTDFVLQVLQSSNVSADAKHMLLWLVTADRPLQLKELEILASIQIDDLTIAERKLEALHILKPLKPLVLVQDGHVFLRHGLIRAAILDIFSKRELVSIKDRHADLATRLLIYIKNTVTQENEPSLVSLEWHDSNILLKKFPLLEFAVRYWVSHVQRTVAYTSEGVVAIVNSFGKALPASITALRLECTLWETIPTPALLSYLNTVTNIYRQMLSENHVVTLQSIVFLALLNQRVECVSDAITLFYKAATISQTVLTTRHIVTMQMAKIFEELTIDSRTESKTEIMVQRETILLLLVECYQNHYGKDSETVVAVLKQLIEHYRWTKEEQRIEEIIVMIETISEHYRKDSVSGDLGVELRRRRGRKSSGITLGFSLDIEEVDELIQEYDSYDVEAWIRQAEAYIAEGKTELAERTYIEIWQRVSKEYRTHYSAYWEERKMIIVLAYSRFLVSQTREYEASSVLSSLWQEYEQASISMSETSVSYFQEVAKMMKVVGISEVALSVFKRCSRYYESISSTHTSTYKELQETIQTTSKEVVKSFSSSTTAISETTLEEFFYESSGSIETFEETSFTATHRLIGQYISQHRWQDATRAVKKVLRIVWPSLFSPSLQDVTLPEQSIDNCVELAERLSFCYHSRRRLNKEEDIRIRLYRAVRAARQVDDDLRDRVTIELLGFFERTAQTESVINLQQELLVDYIDFYGEEHAIVIKTLWTLAELTRPRPIFLEYYRQIIRALNKDSTTCHPEAVEPMIIIATELWNQGRYQDALTHYKILFITFLNQPEGSPKFQVHEFVQELYERYIRCLRIVHVDFAVLYRVTGDYHTACKTTFGLTASITIQATLILARLCQESKRFELEAIALYEELLMIESEEIDLEEISAILDGLYEEQAAIVTSTKESTSSTQVERAVKVMRKRITTVRETHGWAHEESLTRMKEMITFYTERNETETVVQELTEATVQILSSETSSTKLIAAASTIASSYIAAREIQKAVDLCHEIYRQIVMKDTTNVATFQFDLSSKESQSLTFLAHMEYNLRRNSSVTVTEILAALMTEYVYFEEFRSVIKAETSTIYTVSISTARLYQFLVGNSRPIAAAHVFDSFMAYFLATEGERVNVTESSQVKILLITILNHLSIHQSHDFVRTIGIAGNHGVIQLLKEQQYDEACDLAEATFKYLSADEAYRIPAIVKFAFVLGMTISGRDLTTQPDDAIRKKLLGVSASIILDALEVMNEIKIDISQIGLIHLNALIGLLGEQEDYQTLAWLLTLLWNSREAQRSWKPTVTLAMGRRLVLARYLVSDFKSALRLAEDIVYNCRRVHGACHPATLDASILLSQLYTSVGQKYLSQRNGPSLANRYFKKSVAVHENILRIFADPTLGEMENGLENSMSMDDSGYDLEMRESMFASGNGNGGFNGHVSDGEHVRRHLYLLKLATERLGYWPKEYSEYERLNADLIREFQSDLQGVEEVEHWDLKAFGAGQAESDADLVDDGFRGWEILEQQNGGMGMTLAAEEDV